MKNSKGGVRPESWYEKVRSNLSWKRAAPLLADKRKMEAQRVAREFAASQPKPLKIKPTTSMAYNAGPGSFRDDAKEPADREILYKAWAGLSKIREFREIMSVNSNGYKIHEQETTLQFVFQLNMVFSTATFSNMPSPLSMVKVIRELKDALGEHRVKDVIIREMSSCYWSKGQVEGKVLDPFGLHACMVVVLYKSNVKVSDMK